MMLRKEYSHKKRDSNVMDSKAKEPANKRIKKTHHILKRLEEDVRCIHYMWNETEKNFDVLRTKMDYLSLDLQTMMTEETDDEDEKHDRKKQQ